MPYTQDATSRTVTVRGYNIHYHEAGDGPPLIMMHGGGPGAGGWTNYFKNIDRLAVHYRIILPDLVGFGKSSKGPVTETLYKFHAGVMVDFMNELGISCADFVGNSLSGGVTLRLLLTHPDRVRRAILMGPGGGYPLFSHWPTLGLRLGMGYYSDEGPSPEKLQRLLQMMVWDKSLITDELVKSRFQASIDPEIMKNPPLGKGGKLPDEEIWRENLSGVQHKILILWGRDDDVLPFDSGLILLRQLPNAEFHVFSQCGHWVMLERPEDFNDIVLRFLGGPI